ncbi:MAG TPA: formate dehydrogenase [Kiloniellaceae bacterium]
MSNKKEEINAGRRDFFKKAGLGAGAAAVSMTAAKAVAVEATPSKKSGYTETDHVRKYYELARF